MAAHLHKVFGRDVWGETVWPRMQQIVVQTMHSVQDVIPPRKNSFEWFGLDFMVDVDLRLWLCEVNISPDMATVTDVLGRLVPAAADDLFDLILKKKDPADIDPETEQWRLVYRGRLLKTDVLRQRAKARKCKIAELRSGRPFSQRDALLSKCGQDLYATLMSNS